MRWRDKEYPMLKRWHIISDLVRDNKWEVGVEVGVKEGENLFFIMDHCPELKMTGVDAWEKQLSETEGEDYATWNMDGMYARVHAQSAKYKGRLKIIRSFSVEAAKLFEDKSLDFVFIDAQHTYPCLKADIEAWSPKIKDSGKLLGHDIHFPGVLKAVTELIPDYIELGNKVWMRP